MREKALCVGRVSDYKLNCEREKTKIHISLAGCPPGYILGEWNFRASIRLRKF